MIADTSNNPAMRRRLNFFGQQPAAKHEPDPISTTVTARLAADQFHNSESFAALEKELGGGAMQLVARVGAALLPDIVHLNVPLGTAVAQVLGRLTHAEKLSIASGTIPPSVTQTIAAEVATAKEAQRQAELARTQAGDGSVRTDFDASSLLGGGFARAYRGSSNLESRMRADALRGDGLSVASQSPGLTGSAAHYIAHPETVSLANYAKTPYAATGMQHSTFQHLAQHRLPDGGRFSGQTIVHAGEDARVQQFSPSNRRVTTNLATLDHYDPKRRDERNKIFLDVRKTAEQDAEMARLAAAFVAAKTPEERARIKGQIDARGLQLQGKAGLPAHIATLPEPAKAAGRDQGQATIDDVFIKLIPDPKLREELRQQFEANKQVGVDGSPQAQAAWQEGLRKAAGTDPKKLAEVEAFIKQRQDLEQRDGATFLQPISKADAYDAEPVAVQPIKAANGAVPSPPPVAGAPAATAEPPAAKAIDAKSPVPAPSAKAAPDAAPPAAKPADTKTTAPQAPTAQPAAAKTAPKPP